MIFDASINGPNPAGGYVPKVGDKVRRSTWNQNEFVEVSAVGRTFFLGSGPFAPDEDMYELSGARFGDLEPYVEPVVYPELWMNVYRDYISSWRTSRSEADSTASAGRVGVIHLASDGTLTMEAP